MTLARIKSPRDGGVDRAQPGQFAVLECAQADPRSCALRDPCSGSTRLRHGQAPEPLPSREARKTACQQRHRTSPSSTTWRRLRFNSGACSNGRHRSIDTQPQCRAPRHQIDAIRYVTAQAFAPGEGMTGESRSHAAQTIDGARASRRRDGLLVIDMIGCWGSFRRSAATVRRRRDRPRHRSLQ